MVKNIALGLCALVLVSGCSGKKSMSSSEHGMQSQFAREAGSDKVYFAFDKSNVNEEGKATLHKQAEWLKSHDSVKIIIGGHCDERGSQEYNLALGEKRADSVKKILVKHGVNCSRIETISYGKERPEDMGHDEHAHKMNRRAVTVLK